MFQDYDCIREICAYRVRRGSYLEVFHALEIIIRWWSVKTHSVNDLGSQLLKDLRMPRQLIKCETQG